MIFGKYAVAQLGRSRLQGLIEQDVPLFCSGKCKQGVLHHITGRDADPAVLLAARSVVDNARQDAVFCLVFQLRQAVVVPPFD